MHVSKYDYRKHIKWTCIVLFSKSLNHALGFSKHISSISTFYQKLLKKIGWWHPLPKQWELVFLSLPTQKVPHKSELSASEKSKHEEMSSESAEMDFDVHRRFQEFWGLPSFTSEGKSFYAVESFYNLSSAEAKKPWDKKKKSFYPARDGIL